MPDTTPSTSAGDVGLLGATDEQVMALVVERAQTRRCAYTDFGELAAAHRAGLPLEDWLVRLSRLA
jgi:hypothetical protein